MVKEFTFRGKTLEELKSLDTREFAKFLKARQRRTVLRQFDIIEKFISRCEKKQSRGKPIRTHFRHLIIVPKMVGLSIFVYNGKEYVRVNIIAEMLGHRFGEFSTTRGKVQHGAPGLGATRSSAAMSMK
jgi:small subunit ribosomal protein S19